MNPTTKTQKSINIQGKYLAGRDINFNFKSLVYGLILIAIGAVIYLNFNKIVDKYENSQAYFSESDTTSFKLLVLPINPIKNHLSTTEDFQKALIDKLRELESNGDHLSIKKLKSIDIPKSNQEALEILKTRNADMVIWGLYEEIGDNSQVIQINYLLNQELVEKEIIEKNETYRMKILDKNESAIQSLNGGVLKGDAGTIINWIMGMKSFFDSSNPNYADASNFFQKSIENQIIDSITIDDKLLTLGHVFKNFGQHRESSKFVFEYLDRVKKSQDKSEFDLVKAYTTLARNYHELDSLTLAIKYHRLALKEINPLYPLGKDGDSHYSIVYNNLGSFYLKSNPDSAIYYLEKALKVEKQPNKQVGILTNLGEAFIVMRVMKLQRIL